MSVLAELHPTPYISILSPTLCYPPPSPFNTETKTSNFGSKRRNSIHKNSCAALVIAYIIGTHTIEPYPNIEP